MRSRREVILKHHPFQRFPVMPVLCFLAGLMTSCGSSQPFIPPEGQEGNVLAMVTFERHDPGDRYGAGDVKKDFGTRRSWGTYWPFGRVQIDSSTPPRNRVLSVRYPRKKLRSFASGASWYWKSFKPEKDLFFSYWVLFPDSFEFRDGGKLHGFVGGKGNTGGKKPTGHDGWSCRVHWGPGDLIKLYVYHQDQAREWGDTFYFTRNPRTCYIEPGRLLSQSEEKIRIERGRWHHIMIRVRINDIGERNGLAQAWYDGRLVLDVRGFAFRDETCDDDDLLINGVYFSTFFGGRGERYQPVKDEHILFDDLTVSRRPYNPSGITLDPVPE